MIRHFKNQLKCSFVVAATECFDGKSVGPFEVDGKYYVAGWDEKVPQSEANDMCKSIGGVLANIETDEKLLAIR